MRCALQADERISPNLVRSRLAVLFYKHALAIRECPIVSANLDYLLALLGFCHSNRVKYKAGGSNTTPTTTREAHCGGVSNHLAS